jgi:serine/threonine protein kinase
MDSPSSLSSYSEENSYSPMTLSIKSPVVVSYNDMKRTLRDDYGIFEPDEILNDDEERGVCIFKKDSIKYVLKMGNRENRDHTTKYALLQKEDAIYKELHRLSTPQYFPKIYESGDIDKEFYFILMEFIEGKTLYDYVNNVFSTKTSNSDKEVLTILLNLTEALNALWSGGFVHNDLSLENVMVEENLNVKLIDFEKTSKNTDIRFNTIGSMKQGIGYLYLVTMTLKTVKDTAKYETLMEEIRSEVNECKDPKCLTVYSNCIGHIKAAVLSVSGGKRKKSRRRNRNKKSKTRRH